MKKKIDRKKLRYHTERIVEKCNSFALETHKRHVTIKDRHRRPFLAFPMTLGIAAALLLPVIATLGLAAFLINDWQIDVEKRDTK